MKSIAIVLGTRPEIIKMAPVIRACGKKGVGFYILHTGQHYDYAMDAAFFDDLGLPAPKYNLGVGSQEYGKQTGFMIREIMSILRKENTSIVLVQGDTNTVLAGALAANKLGIPIGHHEAGLRSYDLGMLEEINRTITDNISDFLFAPTKESIKNLEAEGIDKSKIFYTGNTVVDAIKQNFDFSQKRGDICKKLSITKKQYILVTAHRAENVDSKERLSNILLGLQLVGKNLNLPIVFPIHPRTHKNIDKFALSFSDEITFVDPVGYLEFLQLEVNASLIITDSGGLQEEASILKVPCVTIRDNTERPETVRADMNILAEMTPDGILKAAKTMFNKDLKQSPDLYGDGMAGERIVELILQKTGVFG